MNKRLLFACGLVISLTAPFFVSADSYNGPSCFDEKITDESTRQNLIQEGQGDLYDINNKVRGTCKKMEVSTIVTLDPSLQKEYILGEHSPVDIEYSDDPLQSKYSEQLFLTSSSSLKTISSSISENPTLYALFDKAYFLPLLSKMFNDKGISFSGTGFPDVTIYVLKKDEISSADLPYVLPIVSNVAPDSLYVQTAGGALAANISQSQGSQKVDTYDAYSFKYQEYGKHIYAPKGDLVESQYVDVISGGNILTNKQLQISQESYGHWGRLSQSVVPITSPLVSVTNYWTFTKRDGKLVLVWQKSEYVLDDGSMKVITNADANVNAAIIFGHNAAMIPSVSTTTPVGEKKGFFSWIIDMVLSWFR